jgi:hypothetical protein
MGRMSTPDFGQDRPGYPGQDYTQPTYPNPQTYRESPYEDPNYAQPPADPNFFQPAEPNYFQPGYPQDAEETQPVAQHFAAPRADWEPRPSWEMDDEPPEGNFGRVVLALGIGSLVAVGLGVYGGTHDPTGEAVSLAGFTSGLHAKAWLASASFALVIIQLLSALAMWGRLPGVRGGGPVSAKLHRWSGRLAVLVSLPVAAHCLYALGFQSYDTRVLVHSLLGCFFYGIFVCKMIVLAKDDQKPWVIPVIGGLVFTGLTGLWLTSSLWFFSNVGVQL